MVFEILQIQVFHICIFMQKLSGISSGKNNKSCRIIHNGSNKIGIAFFLFFYDFIRHFKVPAITQTLFKKALLLQPLKL
jgi:hypothetical protein